MRAGVPTAFWISATPRNLPTAPRNLSQFTPMLSPLHDPARHHARVLLLKFRDGPDALDRFAAQRARDGPHAHDDACQHAEDRQPRVAQALAETPRNLRAQHRLALLRALLCGLHLGR